MLPMKPWPHARKTFRTKVLRSLPAEFDKQQRLIFEAIGYAADAMRMSMERVDTLLFDIQARPETGTAFFVPKHEETVALFIDVWSVVDQMHNLKILIEQAPFIERDEKIQSFLEVARPASLLRNYMDHIGKNMPNVSRKVESPPLFGALTFSWVHELLVKPGFYGGHCMPYVPASGYQHKVTMTGAYNNRIPQTSPIDDVVLHASTFHLNLTDNVGLALTVASHINDLANMMVEESCERLSLERNSLTHIEALSRYVLHMRTDPSIPVKFLTVKDGKVAEVDDTLDRSKWTVLSFPSLKFAPTNG